MAQIQQKGNSGVIVWDEEDWRAGLAPLGSFANLTTLKQTIPGGARLISIDPYRDYGFIQPGFFPDDATNSSVLGGAIVSAVATAAFDFIYGVDNGGKVQQVGSLNSNPPVITNAGSFPHTITGTSPVGKDCVIYKHNSGGTASSNQKYSLFYSYYNNANFDVGSYIDLSSFDDDFMSTVPATPLDVSSGDGDDAAQRAVPHPLCIGSDDILYIGSGRYLHAYDGSTGADGTFTAKALPLPVGFQVVGMLKYNDLLLIAGNYYASSSTSNLESGEALIYVWNYTDLDVTQIIPLSDAYVSSIFMWRGLPHVITYGSYGSHGTVKLKAIVGNSAVKVVDMPLSLPPILRGVDGTGQTLYINGGGKIITVGDKARDTGTEVNYISGVSVAVDNGWIRNFPTIGIFASSANSNSTPKLSKISTLGVTSGSYQSQYVEPPFPVGQYGRIKSVTVVYKNTVTLDSSKGLGVILDTNFNSVNTTVRVPTSLSAPLIKRYTQDNSGNNLPNFINVSLRLVWQNGSSSFVDWFAVSKVILEYELLDFNDA